MTTTENLVALGRQVCAEAMSTPGDTYEAQPIIRQDHFVADFLYAIGLAWQVRLQAVPKYV